MRDTDDGYSDDGRLDLGAASRRRVLVHQAPIGFHISMRLDDERPIAPTPAARRCLARVVLTQGEARGLVAFECADDHLHSEVLTDRVSAGEFARYVQSTLVWQLGLLARFQPARIRPLHDQRHAYNAFDYVHGQQLRHGLTGDPFRDGSSLVDLLGFRVVSPGIIARVREQLPRVRRGQLTRSWPLALALVEDGTLNLDVLADAAAAAFALPSLAGRSADVVRAKRAAVHAAGAGVSSRDLGEALSLSTRTVQEHRAQSIDALAVRAVTLQARLRGVR